MFDSKTSGDITPGNCCDVSSQKHLCKESDIERRLKDALRKMEVGEEFPLNVSAGYKVSKLETALEEYKLSLVDNEPFHMHCGTEIASGLPRNTLERIVKECVVQYQFDTFVNRYAFPKMKSEIPTVALTATTTKEVRCLVSQSLGLRNFVVVGEQSCQVVFELFSILIPKNQYFAEEISIFPRGNNMTKKMYIFLYFH